MGYVDELRTNWRPLLAAAIGMGAGLSLNAYVTSLFAPHVIAAFGWSRADYALLGVTGLLVLPTLPLFGRLADLFGVRRTAAIGVIAYPLGFLAFSQMNGDIRIFFAIAALQTLLGTATTAIVYTRIVAQSFDRARGIALGIAVSGPALVGALASPLLTAFIQAHGWRAGYQVAALVTLLLGVTALLIMPPSKRKADRQAEPARRAGRDYRLIVRSGAFWIIFAGTFLCNLSNIVTTSQFNLVLLDSHATLGTAAMLVSTYAGGVIAGRLACGLALDRFPAHIVAAIGMAMPAIGIFILASSFDATWVLAAAVLLIGVSTGAEGDIAGYLIARIFGIAVYGSVFGLIAAGLGLASALGAILFSYTLRVSGDSVLFLAINGGLLLVGGAMFLLLGRYMRTVV